MLLIRVKEIQIQDLWNREISGSGKSALVKAHMKLYVLHLIKQSTTFKGYSWSLINRAIFYRTIFNSKIFIFNADKNLFDNCNSFKRLQKMLEYSMVFWW